MNEKVIYHTRENRTEIYDLANDPGEKEDLSQHGEERSVSLRELLEFRERNQGLGATRGKGATVQLSEELEESLRRLGYMDR